MKLAFCLFKYFPYGGLQRDFFRIAKACIQLGHEVHIYTVTWDGDTLAGAKLHLLPVKGLQNHVRIASYIKQVEVKIAETPHDLIIGFNKMPFLDVYYAADVCYEHRIRQKHFASYRLLPRYRYYHFLEGQVFARGKKTKILLLNKKQQAIYTQYYQTESERFHLLPPGIDRDRMAPKNADIIREQYRIKYGMTDKHLLLMIGSGFKTKGLDRAIQALAALPQELKQKTYLFVIGQDKSASFEQLAKRLNIKSHIHFLGGRDDALAFLLAADLLIHPAYHENTGTVLLEALAAGLPVLTGDACGYAHYVSEANAGIVLPQPFNQVMLNLALQNLLQNDRTELSHNALSFAHVADIYSLVEKAAAYIEKTGKHNFVSIF